MSKEIPILLNTEMVRAILAGRKTRNRTPSKIQGDFTIEGYQEYPDGSYRVVVFDGHEFGSIKSPFGKPGDVLWVRERLYFDMDAGWKYWADESLVIGDYSSRRTYCPSIHMPKSACRIKLEVKRVWLERVQDISEEDAVAEGITSRSLSAAESMGGEWLFRSTFARLWHDINNNWHENPWVWCCEFEKIDGGEQYATDKI